MYMDDIKLFANKEKKTGDQDTNNKNIHPVYTNGIRHRKMCDIYNDMWGKRNNGMNRTAKSKTQESGILGVKEN